MIYQKAIKWLAFVAICMGMVYTVYNMGYKFGKADATSKCQSQQLRLQTEKLEIGDLLHIEREKRTKHVTDVTTQYHQNISKLQSEVDSLTKRLTTDGLRKDLTRQSCVQDTDNTRGTNDPGECGLHKEDVRDLIELSRRADETAERLTACQGVMEAWKN